MEKLIPTLICIAVVALCFFGIWRGWKSRLKRQSTMFGSLKDVPERYDGLEADAAFEGEYVSTTMFGDARTVWGSTSWGSKQNPRS